MWWNIIMEDWNLGENLLSKWYYLQQYKSVIAIIVLQGMANIVGLTISVGDTTLQSTISIEQDN